MQHSRATASIIDDRWQTMEKPKIRRRKRPWHRHLSEIGHGCCPKISHGNQPWPIFDNIGYNILKKVLKHSDNTEFVLIGLFKLIY
jgi:hypothetical protein